MFLLILAVVAIVCFGNKYNTPIGCCPKCGMSELFDNGEYQYCHHCNYLLHYWP